QPGEKRDRRNRAELHHLVEGEGAPAHVSRHELSDVAVDGDELYADPDAGDGAPEVETEGARLERHDGGGQRVPEERGREDHAPAEAVGDEAEQCRADEKTGEEGG